MGLKPMLEAIYPPPYCPAPNTLPPPPSTLFVCLYQQFMRMIYASTRAGGRTQAVVGVAWRPVTFGKGARTKTNKAKAASRARRSACIYLLFDYKQRREAAAPRLPPSYRPPPPLHPFRFCCCCCYCPLIHIPLDWLLCETLNAKSEQNNTCSINASAGCQLAGSQFPLATSLLPASLEIY